MKQYIALSKDGSMYLGPNSLDGFIFGCRSEIGDEFDPEDWEVFETDGPLNVVLEKKLCLVLTRKS